METTLIPDCCAIQARDWPTTLPKNWNLGDDMKPPSSIMAGTKSAQPGGVSKTHIEGILPKGPYLPCVSMAGRARFAGYINILWALICLRRAGRARFAGYINILWALRFKSSYRYELLNLRALKILMLYKNHIIQGMSRIFCVDTFVISTQNILPIHWKM